MVKIGRTMHDHQEESIGSWGAASHRRVAFFALGACALVAVATVATGPRVGDRGWGGPWSKRGTQRRQELLYDSVTLVSMPSSFCRALKGTTLLRRPVLSRHACVSERRGWATGALRITKFTSEKLMGVCGVHLISFDPCSRRGLKAVRH